MFGKEAEKLEHANDDERTYYIIETEPIVNKYISVPKDKGSLNCATFTAGLIEAVLTNCGFVSYLLCSSFKYKLIILHILIILALQSECTLAQRNNLYG